MTKYLAHYGVKGMKWHKHLKRRDPILDDYKTDQMEMMREGSPEEARKALRTSSNISRAEAMARDSKNAKRRATGEKILARYRRVATANLQKKAIRRKRARDAQKRTK